MTIQKTDDKVFYFECTPEEAHGIDSLKKFEFEGTIYHVKHVSPGIDQGSCLTFLVITR